MNFSPGSPLRFFTPFEMENFGVSEINKNIFNTKEKQNKTKIPLELTGAVFLPNLSSAAGSGGAEW